MPPSASSKRPGLRGDRAGEGALLVAEQLALDERLRDGGAVDLDERAFVRGGVLVDRAGDELLAGAGLAGDEDGGRCVGDLLDDREDLLERRGAADEPEAPEVLALTELGARVLDAEIVGPTALSTICRISSCSKGFSM